MTDDRLFQENEKYGYVSGLTDALKIIDRMVDDNSTIQAWNFDNISMLGKIDHAACYEIANQHGFKRAYMFILGEKDDG